MNNNRTRLELTWIGKDNRPRPEPRILLEDSKLSHHATYKVTASDIFNNILVQGDNLLALKALEFEYSSKIKCVFIDPPYNTGSAFDHYDDGIEHSIWLTMMRDRLEIIRRLLSDDGSLWITIDDNEAHYLKILCDEIFGRTNFVASVIWEKAYSERMDAKGFSTSHDYILIYRKTENFIIKQLTKDQNEKQFNFFDKILNKPYRRRSLRKEGSESKRSDRPSMWYPIEAPDGSEIYPLKPDNTEGRWRWKKDNVIKDKHLLEFVKKGEKWEIYVKQFLESTASRPPNTIWKQDEVGHNHEAKEEAKAFNKIDVFDTPKPERLIQRILTIATNPGDIVLDSFAGSGTTGAVAHKLGRRWIMIELGEHAKTHILPRLKKVVDGQDEGGISLDVNWKGGGGFRFYKLAPSLMELDQRGNWVINKQYNSVMLAEALCKLEGFTYSPSDTIYWQQGFSTEQDFIYITTSTLTHEQLISLSEEVGKERSLLILCSAFRGKADYFNLTIKKIPKQILSRCEWGHDDYSLRIDSLLYAPDKGGQQNLFKNNSTLL